MTQVEMRQRRQWMEQYVADRSSGYGVVRSARDATETVYDVDPRTDRPVA